MRRRRRPILTCVVLALAPAAARGQEPVEEELERVGVHVTSVSGTSVFLDHGRDAGIEPGDRVLLEPPDAAVVEAQVRSVSSRTARAELVERADAVRIDTPGEVLVPKARSRAGAEPPPPAAPPPAAVPDHPPWEHPTEAWDESVPLLAPTKGLEPKEREPRIHGRTYLQLDTTRDDYGLESQDVYASAGVDLCWDNPFERGGELELDAEIVHRVADLEDEPTEDETLFRPRRFSYAWGGTRGERQRFELGRFVQEGFPAFGLLDGVEVAHRVGDDERVGASLGFLTDPDLELGTGGDFQAAAYWRQEIAGTRGFGWGVGAQQTWHDGALDRDLVAADLDWRPTDELMWRASAVVDYYTSGDEIKGPGFELTELHLYGSWRPSRTWGAGLSADRMLWPETDRIDFDPLPPDLLEDREYERLGLRLWTDVTKRVRLSGRTDVWGNEDDSGGGGELRVDWRDLLWDDGRVSAAVFTNEGQSSSIRGLRLALDRDTRLGFWTLAWQLSDVEYDLTFTGDDTLLQQTLRASWDRSLGTDWDVSVYAEELFGDGQDAFSLGFLLQHSF